MNNSIFLVQTDTTAGFLSKSSHKLSEAKRRKKGKEYLHSLSSFRELKESVRVPKKWRRRVRNSEKVTYLYKSIAYRVVNSGEHSRFLKRFGEMLSTSANISGDKFNREKTRDIADIICEDNRGIYESSSSEIVLLGREKRRRLR
jgi:tRNA A37 threonylcarbamoyladenosine synthetase subunit TsaC/SUA5/YrdC